MIEFLLYQSIHPNNSEGILILADHLEEQGDRVGADAIRGLESAGFLSLTLLSVYFSDASPREFGNRSDGEARHFDNYSNVERMHTGIGCFDQFEWARFSGHFEWTEIGFHRSSSVEEVKAVGIGLGDDHTWATRIRSLRGTGMTDTFGFHEGFGSGSRENYAKRRVSEVHTRTDPCGIGLEFHN